MHITLKYVSECRSIHIDKAHIILIGEISELKMKQISQSQFISISDTLCEIVKGLNESQIAATFESVVSRLCSSFDSVVIPPMAAIKKSLDLLIGEQRLDFINGSYYLKSTVVSKPRKKLPTSPHTLTTEIQSANRHVLSSKEVATEDQRHMKREKINGYVRLESEKVKERTKIGKLDINTGNCKTERQKDQKMNKKDPRSFEKRDKRKDKKNKVVKSSSLKVRKRSHCIPRRQFSYEELHSHAKQRELGDKKQIKKRNSFLGKLSRLFRNEDEKLSSDDEIDNDSDAEMCHDGWEKIVTDEQVGLFSNKVETQQKRATSQSREKTNKRKKPKRIKERNIANTKQIHKTRHAGNVLRNKSVQSRRTVYNKRSPSRSSKSSTNASSDEGKTNFGRRKKKLEQKAEWKCSPTREQDESVEKYSLSSYSETSCSNLNNSDYSLSSESSVELVRKSFHYSEEDTTDVESLQASREDGASNFCSTQAICGDLELSTLSLNPSNKITSSSDTSSMKHVEKHLVIPGANNSDQHNLRSRNLVQLIGVL